MQKNAGGVNLHSFTKTQNGSSGFTILQSAPADILSEFMTTLLRMGAGVTFSQTKDGEKLSVTVLANGQLHKQYYEDTHTFTTMMEAVILENQE